MNKFSNFVVPIICRSQRGAKSLAAAVLAVQWSTLWLLVLFAVIWVLDEPTSVRTVVITFWLTVLVEALLKAGENTDTITRLSNPSVLDARGNPNFKFGHAFSTLAWGGVVVGLYVLVDAKLPNTIIIDGALRFVGQNGVLTIDGISMMMWHNLAILSFPSVFWPFFFGTFLRFRVYLRAM